MFLSAHHEIRVPDDVVRVAVVGWEEILGHGGRLVHGPAAGLVLETRVVQSDLQLVPDLKMETLCVCYSKDKRFKGNNGFVKASSIRYLSRSKINKIQVESFQATSLQRSMEI